MNTSVYIGIILFALGLFVWLFGMTKARGLKNGLAPASKSTIRKYQIVGAIGVLLFFSGIILAIFTL